MSRLDALCLEVFEESRMVLLTHGLALREAYAQAQRRFERENALPAANEYNHAALYELVRGNYLSMRDDYAERTFREQWARAREALR